MTKGVRSPGGGFIGVAGSARIGDFVFFGHGGRDELKRVRVHVDVRQRRFDCRHVAAHAFAAGRSRAMMRVFL